MSDLYQSTRKPPTDEGPAPTEARAGLTHAEARARTLEQRALAAEARLAELDKILAFGRFGLFEWEDVHGGEVMVSAEFWHLLRMDREAGRVPSDFLFPLLHPEDLPWVTPRFTKVIQDLSTDVYEVRILTGDGDYRWYDVSFQCNLVDGGTRTTLVGIIRDVHEERLLRERLAEERAKGDFVVRAARAGSFDWPDMDGEYCEIASSLRAVVGLDPAAPFEHHVDFFWQRIHPDFHAAVAAEIERSKHDPEGHYQLEVKLLFEDGRYHWVRSVAKVTALAEAGKYSFVGAMFDIDEEYEAKLNMAEAIERYDLVVEASGAGMYDVRDTRDAAVVVYPGLVAMLGYAEDERERLGERMTEYIHPEDMAVLVAYQRGVLARRERIWRHAFRMRHADGQYRWVKSHGRVTLVAEPDHFRITGAMFDIDAERETQRRAAEANEQLTEFAYIVAHDLSAPMRQIEGYVSILAEEAAAVLSAEHRDFLRQMARVAERSQGMIADLLEFSRLGTVALRREEVALGPLVSDLREMLDAGGRGGEWHLDELGSVTGDRTQLRLLFQNLLANAVKFSRVRGAGARIRVELVRAGEDELELCVRDNSIGFSPEYGEMIFKAFTRAVDQDSAVEGTGIGLANVARIVQRHGGRVRAEGVVGAGAAFYVALPR